MKKLLLAAVAMTVATPALAAGPVTVDVVGNVPLQCEVVANPSIVNPESVDLSNTSTDQTLGSLAYRCNNAGGFTRTISSTNGSKLKRAGGGASENTIAYTVSHGGGSGLMLGNTSLAQPVTTTLAGSTAFVEGQDGSIRVRVGQASGALFAGNYGDTITVSIAPNN